MPEAVGRSGRRRSVSRPLLLVLVGLAWLLPSASAEAATFVVTNTNDAGGASLREAINAANGVPGADDVVIGTSGIISLQSPLPTVTRV